MTEWIVKDITRGNVAYKEQRMVHGEYLFFI